MAQTKRKRRRKHRGTQGGRVTTSPKGRPRSREEARARAKRGRQERGLQAPTWRGALQKGALAAGLFFLLFAALFSRPIGVSAVISVFMLVFYVPMSYYLDGFFYRRRTRQQGGAGD